MELNRTIRLFSSNNFSELLTKKTRFNHRLSSGIHRRSEMCQATFSFLSDCRHFHVITMSKELMDALKLREEWQRKVEVQNYELKLLKESVYKKREMLRNLERKSTDLQEQNRAIKNLKKNLAASSQIDPHTRTMFELLNEKTDKTQQKFQSDMQKVQEQLSKIRLSRKKFENLKSNSEWVQKLSAEKKRLEVIRGVVEQKKKDIEVAKKRYDESKTLLEERSKWELNKWIVTMVSDAMERKRMLKKLAALLVKKAALEKKYAEKIDASNDLMEIDNLENCAQTDSPIKQPTSQQPTENQQETNADNEAEQMSDEEPPAKQSRVIRSEKKTKSEHQKQAEQLQPIQELRTENANEEEMNVQNVEEERRPEEETEASSRNVVNIRIDEDEEEEDERNESPIGNFFNDFSTPSRSNDNNDSIDFIFGTPSDAQTPPNPKPKTPKRSLPATSIRNENPRTESPFGGLNLDDIGNDGLFNLSNNLFGSQNDEGPGFSIGSGVDASPGGLFPSMNSPHTTSPFNFNTSHNKDNSPQPFFDF